MAELLEPVLEEVARVLETASSGLVKADTRVAAGKTGPAGNAPVPVALWIAGPGEDAVSTEVLSFTVESPEALHAEVLRTVFRLVRVHLARGTAYTPPARLAEGEDPAEALATRITRLSWSEFATALNLEPKKED